MTSSEISTRGVRYGVAAAHALCEEISRLKGDDPFTLVTVVVPTNQVGVAVRRQVASGRVGTPINDLAGLVGVSFTNMYRLAEHLGAAAMASSGRRKVSTPGLAAALRSALTADPGVFARVLDHPNTESALVGAYRELRHLSEEDLSALEKRNNKVRDVVRLYRAARALLEPQFYDEHDLVQSATHFVASPSGRTHLTERVGPIILFLPQQLSPHTVELLQAVAAQISVSIIAGFTGDLRADAEITAVLKHLNANFAVESPERPLWMVGTDSTMLVTTSDAEEEVRAATHEVMAAARGGVPFGRIAILHPDEETYGPLIHEHLRAAGIPSNGAPYAAPARCAVGNTLLRALDLSQSDLRRDELMSWITGAPLLFDGHLAFTSTWDRISRLAGTARGYADWDEKLARYEQRLLHEADAQERQDGPSSKTERLRADAKHAQDLRQFVVDLVGDITSAAPTSRSWAEWSRWTRRLLRRLLGGTQRRALWPREQQRGAEAVEKAIERLSDLDSIESSISFAVFVRTLRAELAVTTGRMGRLGDGVCVGPISLGLGLDLDVVIIVGLAEGTFPARTRDDSLLPDEDRATTGGALTLHGNATDQAHHQFLSALAAAPRQILTIPRGDLRQTRGQLPSRWALDVASELNETRMWPPDFLRSQQPWLRHIASYESGLRTRRPVSEQEQRLRTLLVLDPSPDELVAAAGQVDKTLLRGATLTEARASARFTRFDGNVAGEVIPSPLGGTSATRLERWAACPFAYFAQDVLGIEPVENPEEILTISALDRGSLIHSILESFIGDVLKRPQSDQPSPDQPWTAIDHDHLSEIAEQQFVAYEADGLTGRQLFWNQQRRIISNNLHRILDQDSDRRKTSRLRPFAAELAFGLGSGSEPLTLTFADGRHIRLRGRADRVDVAEDGTVVVVDYKTGSSENYLDLTSDDPHPGGLFLQLPLYGLAARNAVGNAGAKMDARYWFVSSRGDLAEIGYIVGDDVLEKTRSTIATIVDGIDAGVFPQHPPAKQGTFGPDCDYCFPDGAHSNAPRRRWDAKANDPRLQSYLALCGDEPQADESEQQ